MSRHARLTRGCDMAVRAKNKEWYEKTAFEIIHQLADGPASRAHQATGAASIGQTAAPYVPIAFYSRASLTPPLVLCT